MTPISKLLAKLFHCSYYEFLLYGPCRLGLGYPFPISNLFLTWHSKTSVVMDRPRLSFRQLLGWLRIPFLLIREMVGQKTVSDLLGASKSDKQKPTDLNQYMYRKCFRPVAKVTTVCHV